MNFKIFLAGYILVFLSACSVKEDLCAAYQCSASVMNLKLKFMDSNNLDLLFSTNAVHKLSDLKIQSSLSTIDLPFGIDSMDKNNRYVLIPFYHSQKLKIKLANAQEDNIEIETVLQEARCCEIMKILNFKVNGITICSNCSGIEPIVLIK
jgi:hypothetical protein